MQAAASPCSIALRVAAWGVDRQTQVSGKMKENTPSVSSAVGKKPVWPMLAGLVCCAVSGL